MRWVKWGSMGAMNHAAGAGGGLHSVTTICGGGVEEDRQPQVSSSKAITQACLLGLLIGQGSVMGLVAGCQPLLQGNAFVLLRQNQRGVGIGKVPVTCRPRLWRCSRIAWPAG